jgi:ATP phosphoribosyltransferase
VPKGRILEELRPLLARAGIEPEAAFDDSADRQLRFATARGDVALIRVRAFDVATFVAFGAAHLGVAGADVLMEFDDPEIYAPLDLGIGQCRLSVAMPAEAPGTGPGQAPGQGLGPAGGAGTAARPSHVRVATKYPATTRRYYAAQGIQAETIKLNGAMELAPSLGLARRIVDLVSTGRTLAANGLREVETIAPITSRLIVNRTAYKTRPREIRPLIDAFARAAG